MIQTNNPLKNLQKNTKSMLNKLPTYMAGIAVREFQLNFRRQSFFSGPKWKKIQSGKTSGILIQDGTLRTSIHTTQANSSKIVISSFVPYAQAHNQGGVQFIKPHKRTSSSKGIRYNVSGYNFKLPKRQFMGNHKDLSATLNKKIKEKYNFKALLK